MKTCFYDFCDNLVDEDGPDFCSNECSIDFDRLVEDTTERDEELPHEDDECDCDDCQG